MSTDYHGPMGPDEWRDRWANAETQAMVLPQPVGPFERPERRRWPMMLGIAVFLILLGSCAAVTLSALTPDKFDTVPADTGDPVTAAANLAHPPLRDVKITRTWTSDVLGVGVATVHVTNHSSKRSDYLITVEFLDADGVRLDETINGITDLRPGRTAKLDVYGYKNLHKSEDVRGHIVRVERFAAG